MNSTVYTADNIRYYTIKDNPLIYRRDDFAGKWEKYELMTDIQVRLEEAGKQKTVIIPKGFKWDHCSVPQLLRWLFRPNLAAMAWLIHDYLYKTFDHPFSASEAHEIMLDWSIALYGTDKWSLRNIDLYLRYYTVKLVGGKRWRDNRKL